MHKAADRPPLLFLMKSVQVRAQRDFPEGVGDSKETFATGFQA
jgi:hypothetical protein